MNWKCSIIFFYKFFLWISCSKKLIKSSKVINEINKINRILKFFIIKIISINNKYIAEVKT